MLEVVFKFCIGLITSVAGFFVLKNLLKSDEKLLCLRNILLILILVSPTVFLYHEEYSLLNTITTFLVSVVVYKNIFKLSVVKSILAVTTLIVIMGISDMFVSSGLMFFVSKESLRSNGIIMIISNLLVGTIMVLISNIKILKNKVPVFLQSLTSKHYVSSIVFGILSVMIIISIFYHLGNNYELNKYYLGNILVLIIFLILYFIYVREKVNYNYLNERYDQLFDYVQTFEEWIEDEQASRHDLKNSLSEIIEMTENQEILTKINEILEQNIKIEEKWIEQLKNIPKGGLKGLLYYKLAIAKKEKVTVVTDVSEKVTDKIKKIKKDDIKILSRIIGIYLDNAIEAAAISKKKLVTIEIYTIKQELFVVISNSFVGNIDLEKINRKGVSTKGKGHGNGLYYANKLINKSKCLANENRIINNYFVQKLRMS